MKSWVSIITQRDDLQQQILLGLRCPHRRPPLAGPAQEHGVEAFLFLEASQMLRQTQGWGSTQSRQVESLERSAELCQRAGNRIPEANMILRVKWP